VLRRSSPEKWIVALLVVARNDGLWRFGCLAVAALVINLLAFPLYAQEEAATQFLQQEKDVPAPVTEAVRRKVALVNAIQSALPAERRVVSVIERFVARLPEDQRGLAKQQLLSLIPPLAIQQIEFDAYMEIYSVRELEAMLAFYSSEEGQSVLAKTGRYEAIVGPRIAGLMERSLERAAQAASAAEDETEAVE